MIYERLSLFDNEKPRSDHFMECGERKVTNCFVFIVRSITRSFCECQ